MEDLLDNFIQMPAVHAPTYIVSDTNTQKSYILPFVSGRLRFHKMGLEVSSFSLTSVTFFSRWTFTAVIDSYAQNSFFCFGPLIDTKTTQFVHPIDDWILMQKRLKKQP